MQPRVSTELALGSLDLRRLCSLATRGKAITGTTVRHHSLGTEGLEVSGYPMPLFSCSCWLPKAAFLGSFPSPPLECACSPPSALPGKLPHSGGTGCAHTSGSLLPRAQNPGPICHSGRSTQKTHRHPSLGMASPPPFQIPCL